MKKIHCLVAVLLCALVLVLFTGCATATIPGQKDSVTTALVEKDYRILGRVEYSGNITSILGLFTFGGAGYRDMLSQAQKQYPMADEVINVTKDEGYKIILGVYNRLTYTMSGLAIQYIN